MWLHCKNQAFEMIKKKKKQIHKIMRNFKINLNTFFKEMFWFDTFQHHQYP